MDGLMTETDRARSLASPVAIERRLAMLNEPHIRPLTQFVERLREENPCVEFPYFDPMDGGVNADILFLMEKPGPKTSIAGGGSGFISRNNNDPTAEAIFGFMHQAGIPRERVVLWNVIPGWDGEVKVKSAELNRGVEHVGSLLILLPMVRTVVFVGRKAEMARPLLEHLPLRFLATVHPSMQVRNSPLTRQRWEAIPSIWAQAAAGD